MPKTNDPIAERLTVLEMRVAYFEKANDELSEVVRELFSKIAALEKQVREGGTGPAGAAARAPEDEKPPHY